MTRFKDAARQVLHRVIVAAGAIALTLLFFLVLPLMQTIGKDPPESMRLQSVDIASLDPPPPPPEEEPEPEPEPEQQPPELQQQTEPLDLAELELALNSDGAGGAFAGGLNIQLDGAVTRAGGLDDLFSMSQLDQRPRPTYQASPVFNAEMRRAAPGTVYVIFIVNEQGRVEQAKVQSSTHPIFSGPALEAVKKWRFEPGQRNGQPVRFRMRVPISFPKTGA